MNNGFPMHNFGTTTTGQATGRMGWTFTAEIPDCQALEKRSRRPDLPRLTRGASEALADPIVQALMAADGLDPRDVEAFLRRAAARVADWRATAAQSA
jgi:hypothetical protein